MRRPVAVSICLLAFAVPAGAQDRIDELFGAGAFGVAWDATPAQVAVVHPSGKNARLNETATMYTVRDGRRILELERKSRDEITFMFVEESLRGISVEFSNCLDVVARLHQVIGTPDIPGGSPPASGEFGIVDFGMWRGKGVSVGVVATYSSRSISCMLTISTPLRERNQVSRSDLGLE